MVQTYQAPTKVYHYPFDIVMEAYEKRFPSCKQIPIFLDSEILEETCIENKRITKRRCKLRVDAPYLLKKIIGMDHANFIQINTLDYNLKVLCIEAFNENFTSRVEMNEICYYKVHPDNPALTTFDQEATLNIKSFFNFEAALEKVIIKHYINNISKGKEVLIYFIKEMEKDKDFYKRHKSYEKNINLISEEDQETLPHESQFSFMKSSGSHSHGFIYLTPLQENKLNQLKRFVKEKYIAKIPDDAHILRFLRARDYNIEKAGEMLVQSLIWRKHHKIDKIISSYQIPEVIQNYFPGGWLSHNKYGIPLYCLRLGDMDFKGLYSSLGMDGIIKHVLYVCEEGFELCQKCQSNETLNSSNPALNQKNVNIKTEHGEATSQNELFKGSLKKEEGIECSSNGSIGRGSIISFPNLMAPDCTDSNNKTHKYWSYSWNLLLDCTGLGVRHLWTPGIKAILKIVEIVEANYPETLNSVWVVGAPWIFPVIWTLVSPFIDNETKDKFVFYDSPQHPTPDNDVPRDVLSGEIVATKNTGTNNVTPKSEEECFVSLPRNSDVQGTDVQGGEIKNRSPHPDITLLDSILINSKKQINAGGIVPKSYYLSEAALNDQNNSFKDNIYQSVNIAKGHIHEVIIEIKENGSVLTWDFDVTRCGCTFQVIYTPLPISTLQTTNPSSSSFSSPSVLSPALALTNLSTSGSNESHKMAGHVDKPPFGILTHNGTLSSIPQTKENGLDYMVIEPPLHCHEGESIQGSHFAKSSGCYILQWHYTDINTPKIASTAFDFSSLTYPKCKIMYFYEIIHSDAYKGSMSSLHSITSGFSSLNTADLSFNQHSSSPTSTTLNESTLRTSNL